MISFLRNLWNGFRQSLAPAASDDYWYTKVSQGTTAGVRVDEDVALNYSAVWAATRIYAETVASLPLWIYERLPGRVKADASDFYLFPILHTAPNPEMDSFTFWESRVAHAVNWGNGFAEIEWTKSGRVLNLWPIHPSRVKPDRTDDARRARVYKVRNNNGRPDTTIAAQDMFHIVGPLSEDGLWGKGTIAQARESIGMGLSTERYGASFFGNGARPGGVLKTEQKYSEMANRELRESWNRVHQGPGQAHQTAVLWGGMDYKAIDIPPEDAQFLQTRQHNITEIARWYRLPVHMLAELTRATNNNIEAEMLGFVVHSLRPWLVRIERAIGRQLFRPTQDGRFFVEFLLDALLRGDMLTRTQALAQQFQNGALTLNEWRAIENRNPVQGDYGDKHYAQMQMVPLGEADPTSADGAEPGAILDVPDYRQQGDYDCGAAATHSVCAYFGVGPETEEEMIAELGTTPADGTRPAQIIGLLNRYGLAATSGNGMTLDDLTRFHQDGRPVICPIQDYGTPEEEAEEQSGHYVVVIGRGMGVVVIQDPSAGRAMVDEDEFLSHWMDRDADGVEYRQYGIAVGREVLPDDAADTPEAKTDQEQPPTGGAGQQAEEESGLSAVLKATWERMLKIEANEQRRAAKRPERYAERMRKFYEGFRGKLAKALEPVVGQGTASVMAGRHVDRALDRLDNSGDFADAPTSEVHGLTVRVVDATKVRGRSPGDEEFGNFGIHAQFPDLIPEGEVWISDETDPAERHFFVDNAAVMQAALDRGLGLDQAKAEGLAREKRARDREAQAEGWTPGRNGTPPDDIYVSLYQEDTDPDGEKLEVWLVDGKMVRDLYRTQFHESGHGYIYDWIPLNEIWLESRLSEADRKFDLLHEETERSLMKDEHMSYDDAHEQAAKAEFQARRKAKEE